MKHIILLATLIGLSFAQAQTLAQKKMQKDSEAALKEYTARMKNSCGCVPKMQFDYKEYNNESEALMPTRVASDVADAFEKICKDADSKKTVCSKLKTVVGKKGTPVDPTFKNGTLTVIRTTDNGYGDVTDVLSHNL